MSVLKNLLVKLFFAVVLLSFIWVSLVLCLPSGNHLAKLVYSERKFSGMSNFFEKTFASKFVSRLYFSVFDVPCDMRLLISNGFFPGEYIHMPNGTLASVMDFYIDSRGSYSFLEEAEARDLVRKVIVRCNPNISYTGEPPLVIAIYSGDVDFVDRLMRRGADPYMEYVAKKGVKMNAIKMLDGFLKSSSENEPSLERYRKVAEVMSGFGFSKDGR